MKNVWMDGVIKTPHYDIYQVYTREKKGEKQNSLRGKSPSQKGEGDEVVLPP